MVIPGGARNLCFDKETPHCVRNDARSKIWSAVYRLLSAIYCLLSFTFKYFSGSLLKLFMQLRAQKWYFAPLYSDT